MSSENRYSSRTTEERTRSATDETGRTNGISRRRVLTATGAGLGAIAIGPGTASAQPSRRYIVGTATRRATRAAQRAADSVHRVLDFGTIGEAVAGTYPEAALDGLRRRPDVRYIEPDGQMHAISIDSTDSEVPWGVDRVDAEKVHASTTGSGADVAILDTGIDSDHSDLQANLGFGKAFVSARGPYAEPWDDDNGHGTHCAGIAAAVDNGDGVVGVSTQATLHAVKVLDKNGSGSWSDIAAGIEYTADQGWHVASMSLGGGRSQTIENACLYAYERGVLLVAAAGNNGCESDYTVDDYSCDGCVSAPASYSTVIAVSSTTRDDSVSGFSSAGCAVELAAPGSDIYSTVPGGYGTKSGTSMACPHVSGAGALLMASGMKNADNRADPDNPGGARGQLRDTAERETHEGKTLVPSGMERNNLYGFGLLDVEAAVRGGSDGAPSVSWVNPSDGTSVSGTVTIRIDASDTEDGDDSLTVEYSVDGGSWTMASYNSSTGYYEDAWDSTGVSDGEHTLDARATDSASNTGTSSVTFTTDNVDSAPSVAWVSPSDGDTVSGSVSIRIDATDDADTEGSPTVEWQVDDGTWRTATYDSSSGYYEDTWDSTGVSDGEHTLDARASDSAGNVSAQSTVTVTVTTNAVPTADFEYSRKGNSTNVTLDGSPATDPDGSIVSYEWDIGADGSFEYAGQLVENADVPAGTDVLLRVTDDDGATDSTTRTVS